jgi:hypothetical protein
VLTWATKILGIVIEILSLELFIILRLFAMLKTAVLTQNRYHKRLLPDPMEAGGPVKARL